MDLGTPLADVARLLPADGAILLLHEPPWIQNAVLSVVREYMIALERHGIMLNPIDLEADLRRVVYNVLSGLKEDS